MQHAADRGRNERRRGDDRDGASEINSGTEIRETTRSGEDDGDAGGGVTVRV